MTLPCGTCINSGYIYCRKGNNFQEFDRDPEDFICCKDVDSCLESKDPTYTCSHVYENKLMAKKVCPFVRPVCGGDNVRNIGLENVGDKKVVNIRGLQEGHTCVYKLQAKCGYPKVR